MMTPHAYTEETKDSHTDTNHGGSVAMTGTSRLQPPVPRRFASLTHAARAPPTQPAFNHELHKMRTSFATEVDSLSHAWSDVSLRVSSLSAEVREGVASLTVARQRVESGLAEVSRSLVTLQQRLAFHERSATIQHSNDLREQANMRETITRIKRRVGLAEGAEDDEPLPGEATNERLAYDERKHTYDTRDPHSQEDRAGADPPVNVPIPSTAAGESPSSNAPPLFEPSLSGVAHPHPPSTRVAELPHPSVQAAPDVSRDADDHASASDPPDGADSDDSWHPGGGSDDEENDRAKKRRKKSAASASLNQRVDMEAPARTGPTGAPMQTQSPMQHGSTRTPFDVAWLFNAHVSPPAPRMRGGLESQSSRARLPGNKRLAASEAQVVRPHTSGDSHTDGRPPPAPTPATTPRANHSLFDVLQSDSTRLTSKAPRSSPVPQPRDLHSRDTAHAIGGPPPPLPAETRASPSPPPFSPPPPRRVLPFGTKPPVSHEGEIYTRTSGRSSLRTLKRPNYAEIDPPNDHQMAHFTTVLTQQAGWTSPPRHKRQKIRPEQ